MIQRHKLTEADFRGERFKDHPKDLQGNNDLLILTRPDVISEIHGQYLAAGADIIETNTFSSTTVAQADYLLEHVAYELNLEGARLAKAAARPSGRRRRPTARASSPARSARRTARCRFRPRSTTRRSARSRSTSCATPTRSRCAASSTAASDLILLETIFDTLNAKAGIVAIENVFAEKGVRLPLMISFTITDKSGRTLSGQTLEAFYTSVRHAHPFSIGINCALGARDMRPYLADLARIAECYVIELPERRPAERVRRVRRAARRDQRAGEGLRHQRLRQHRRRLLRHDARSHRGHCRRPSTGIPPRVAARGRAGVHLHRAVRPRAPGRSALTRNFQMVGERTNVTGSAKFARLDQGRATGPKRRTSRSTRSAAAPTSSTSTWTKACSTPSRR